MSKTVTFSVESEKDAYIRQTLITVTNALKEKGYNPINQIIGYILSEDPTYITTYNNARTLITRLDRDDILENILSFYLDNE